MPSPSYSPVPSRRRSGHRRSRSRSPCRNHRRSDRRSRASDRDEDDDDQPRQWRPSSKRSHVSSPLPAPLVNTTVNYELSGLLAIDAAQRRGEVAVAIPSKYREPADTALPEARDQWRLYTLKAGREACAPIALRTSSVRVGRDSGCDVPMAHPSVSAHHAVIQFRRPSSDSRAKPYLIDLESTHGTTLNGQPIEASRYIELRAKDVIQFAHSSREFVLVNDQS